MIEFNLEQALAGEAVITRDGEYVTQLTEYDIENKDFNIYGVSDGVLDCWGKKGNFTSLGPHPNDLFMEPKAIIGFVNCDADGHLDVYDTKEEADDAANRDRVACIALSQHLQGEGLD